MKRLTRDGGATPTGTISGPSSQVSGDGDGGPSGLLTTGGDGAAGNTGDGGDGEGEGQASVPPPTPALSSGPSLGDGEGDGPSLNANFPKNTTSSSASPSSRSVKKNLSKALKEKKQKDKKFLKDLKKQEAMKSNYTPAGLPPVVQFTGCQVLTPMANGSYAPATDDDGNFRPVPYMLDIEVPCQDRVGLNQVFLSWKGYEV